MKKKLWFVGLMVFSLMLFTNVCVAKDVQLVIGASMDLTAALRQTGIPMGWNDYFKYVNEEKGGINGAKLVLRWADDEYKADKVIAWYQSVMAGDPKPLMYWPQHTTGGVALKELMKKDGIAGLSFSPAGVIVYPPATIYTSCATYQDGVGMFFDWILMNWKEKRKPRFAWISGDNPFGRDAARKEIKDYAAKVGIEIVGEEYVPPIPVDSTINLKRLIRDRKADFLFTNAVSPTLIPLLRDAVRLGLRKRVTWGGCYFVDPMELLRVAKTDPLLAEGIEGLFIPFMYPQFVEPEDPAIKLAMKISQKYQGTPIPPGKAGEYIHGMVEGVLSEHIFRLVAEKVPVEKMTKDHMEEYGFWRVKDYDVKGFLGGATLTWGKDLSHCGMKSSKPMQFTKTGIRRLDVKLVPRGLP